MVSQFRTGNHGELFYMLLILKTFQWPELGLSFQGESIPGQEMAQYRRGKKEKKPRLRDQVRMGHKQLRPVLAMNLAGVLIR